MQVFANLLAWNFPFFANNSFRISSSSEPQSKTFCFTNKSSLQQSSILCQVPGPLFFCPLSRVAGFFKSWLYLWVTFQSATSCDRIHYKIQVFSLLFLQWSPPTSACDHLLAWMLSQFRLLFPLYFWYQQCLTFPPPSSFNYSIFLQHFSVTLGKRFRFNLPFSSIIEI